jgi:hypothetical protein
VNIIKNKIKNELFFLIRFIQFLPLQSSALSISAWLI